MNKLERAALNHAREQIAYERSPQAAADRKADKAAREAADKKAGHTPLCGLMRCHPSCSRAKA